MSVADTRQAALPEPPPPPPPAKRLAAVLGLVALAASALLGANLFGTRDRLLGSAAPEPRPAAVSRAADEPAAAVEPQQSVLRSQPWWQRVTALEGSGPTTSTPFTIDDGAIQWRVAWTCETGDLVVREAAASEPLVDATCPGSDTGYSTETGAKSLAVNAAGPWQLQVEQQLDVPLVEPPLPAMTDPGTVVETTGSFYRMDQSGTGVVNIYRLADGSAALRLDDFFVTPNVDLEIHLSPLEAPHTTEEFLSVPSVEVAPLDVTAGSMNFTVPSGIDPSRYRSVVIWCPLINSAYAAATLVPAQP